MINFNWVEFANFLSVGKTPVHIDITKNQTTLIRGHNGAGKTTILEAIIYGLFNKPFRNIKLGQLKNSINKRKMMVKINFTTRGITYEIHRGQSPKVFKLFSDEHGEMKEVDATNDLQKYIENDILNTNLKTFTQAVVMASMKYQNFMDLSVGDRRIVVNQMLDLEVLTTMKDLLTKRKSAANKAAADIESRYMNIRYQIEAVNRVIEEMQKNAGDDIELRKDEIKKLEDGLGDLNNKLAAVKAKVDEHKNLTPRVDVDAIESEIATLRGQITEEISKRTLAGQTYNNDFSLAQFYAQNTQCDRCHQEITDAFRKGELSRLQKTTTDAKLSGSKCNDNIMVLEAKISDCQAQLKVFADWNTELNNLYNEARPIQSNISTVQEMINIRNQQLSEAMDKGSEDTTEKQAELAKMNNDFEYIIAERAAVTKELEMCDLTAQILSDKGVKAKVIREYLPVINQSINYYLDVMGANYSFVLDEQFNETILSRYRDNFSYGSFSNGEATRINFAIVFMLRKVAMMKNSVATNLLFLDEVFDGSLDKEGFIYAAKLMDEMKDNNVFVISHRKEMETLVEHIIEVEKIGNFSTYTGV